MVELDSSLEKEIEREYKKIDEKWLFIHYLISVGLVILSFFLECGIGRLMYVSGEISTTMPRYLMKYLFIPSTLNGILIAVNYTVVHSRHLSQEFRIFTVSFILVGICFIIFTVHSLFQSLFFIFSLPILLTAIYGIYRLSVLTSLLSIGALILSELVIKWDLDVVNVLENGTRLANFLIAVVTLLSFSAVSIILIHFEKIKNRAGLRKELERHKLRKRLEIDDLTGISNRIAFRNAIGEMAEDDQENSYTFVMIDLDNFKLLNDCQGHVAGDNCLIGFAEILKKNCGDALSFRYGGDEFSILLKNSTMDHIVGICEQIQSDFKTLLQTLPSSLPLSVSIGIAVYSKGMTPFELITNSDTALYQSKKVKNRITLYNDSLVRDESLNAEGDRKKRTILTCS